ncbi:beta-ketoacyl synthase N-terminal-like domain-containing protein [Azonexus sp. IMCC34839]|uniref:beta-ketoacyl synthase N-terminal-like domain-containing protein n=1 Tax=Azonexus sp. IMCC34839 TaxID=3133695 RepID=UPI0039997A9B
MSRPVHLAANALVSARGLSVVEATVAILAGETACAQRRLGERTFPYFALPFAENDWLKRAEQACAALRAQLSGLAAETPLFVASSSFQMGLFEQQRQYFDLPRACASFADELANWLGLSGSRTCFSNACVSGFSALDAAATLIAAGIIDDALVLGVELANASTLAGFASMELLSPDVCRPFDRQRNGLVLGEALAAVHLTAQPGAWRIAGLSVGLDAYSTTGPDPQGGPIAAAAVHCLKTAKTEPADIQLIKLQAAGSPGTDLAEANALRQVFGDALPPLVSLKPYLGHTLGASGIAELSALLACLDAGFIPGTPGFSEIDPDIGLSPTLSVEPRHIDRLLLNLIGFGGGLANLVVERA